MVKSPSTNAGATGSIPGLERSPREGNDNPLQYSCLGNPMDREAWQAKVHEVTKESDTTEQFHFTSLLGGGNGTHSSVLVWEIPWTEKPGGLQSMGSQKSWTSLSG